MPAPTLGPGPQPPTSSRSFTDRTYMWSLRRSSLLRWSLGSTGHGNNTPRETRTAHCLLQSGCALTWASPSAEGDIVHYNSVPGELRKMRPPCEQATHILTATCYQH